MAHQHIKAISARITTVLIINNKLLHYDSKFKNSEWKYDKKAKVYNKYQFLLYNKQ